MKRRNFLLTGAAGLSALSLLGIRVLAGDKQVTGKIDDIEKIEKTEAQWREILTPEQFHVLREEGTEPPFTSPLNDEKRKGTYVCAGCELPLFTSEMKYDSGTGWPSFFTHIDGRLETKLDFKLILPRTEYHCARCDGHQGHVFEDGPEPTGERWCNNGVALKFVPAQSAEAAS